MNNSPSGVSINNVSALLKRENMPDPHYLAEQTAYISKFETVMLPYKNDLLKSFGHAPIAETIEIADSLGGRERCQSTPSKYSGAGDKPYQCETCKKTFSQQSNLCKHVLIHYGVKPFGCETCGKRFTQQANLIKHKRIHTGDKPYVCRVCLRQFSQNANLKKHIHLHTGEKRYRCEFCDKTFVQQANLDRHRRTHTGEKPFLCNVCQKRFTQKGNLLKHEVIHFVKESSRQVSQFSKAPEKGSIESLLSTSEAITHEASLHESYHRRLSIPMMLSSREKVYFKR